MPQQIDDTTRQVVPRWRPFAVAASLGVLSESGPSRGPLDASPGELEQLKRDWNQHRSPFHAMNLIDAAVVLNRPEIASEAARFLLSEPQNELHERSLARFVLGDIPKAAFTSPPELTLQDRYKRIAKARRSLHQHPRNPI